jgi:hypothetical protein
VNGAYIYQAHDLRTKGAVTGHMTALDIFLDAPVCSIMMGMLVVLFGESCLHKVAHGKTNTFFVLCLVGSLVAGEMFSKRTSLILADTVGSNFYIW